MTQTANAYLNQMISDWTPSQGYFDKHRAHKAGIELRLDLWLGVHDMFETGSLRHGTGIKIASDADYFAVLKGERPTPTTALTHVKDALVDRYPNTTIQIRRPTVKCLFAGGSETVEVCPAYRADDGGYWIPDPADSAKWMKSHPSDHNRYVNAVNTKHNGGAKKLTRLAKIWKYRRSLPVSSCYLEMRAAEYADGESTWAMTIDLHRYLKRLHDISLRAMNDPTELGSRFTATSSPSNTSDALSKLDTAVDRAKAARDYASEGRDAQAVARLRILFND